MNLQSAKCQRCSLRIRAEHMASHEFDDHVTEILPNLFLGGYEGLKKKEELTFEVKATHVINCAEELDDLHCGAFKYIHFSMRDCESQVVPFEEVCEAIDLACSTGGRVVVHCMAGVSRSATVVIAYLMASLGLSFESALRFVKERRKIISPNPGFIEQLKAWEGRLQGRRLSENAAGPAPVAIQSLSG